MVNTSLLILKFEPPALPRESIQLHYHSRHSPTHHSRPSYTTQLLRYPGLAKTVIIPFLHYKRIPQVPDMFFRSYLCNILMSRPYLKQRDLFIFCQNIDSQARSFDRDIALPSRQRK